ncbi:hypothetical protein IGI04_002549 [Brassica rapa subsp. trilocularis]|uniref:DUF4283 domain-containing protein n=1 Tax=Brassica rapa subsp. trilocularis TaxID=1813537 RepID=A0ABQ7NVU6_BRACM|nr:hypothetical protein IGI04_002549 [Brassica rapa subsp. trilocularis]
MFSRRWDPGIISGDWIGVENQDEWKRGFHSIYLRISLQIILEFDLGIFKESLGRLRKFKIGFQWRSNPIIIKTETWLQEGGLQDSNFGKVADVPDNKWVKVADKSHRRPSNYHGSYRGESEGSRSKAGRREDGRNGNQEGGSGAQEGLTRVESGRPSVYQAPSVTHMDVREEGEVQTTGGDEMLPSVEFQRELAKTQEDRTDLQLGPLDKDKEVLVTSGVNEEQDGLIDDIDLELETINATLMETGVDMEAEDEFQTLSEEEAEQVFRAQEERGSMQEEETVVTDGADNDRGTGAGEVAMRQGSRKRLFKPSINTAGSTKMRIANALLSPRKKGVAKVGPRHGEGSKPMESKGPSNPKPTNLKF